MDITDEMHRYVLYRFSHEDGADLWLMDDLRSEAKPLTRESFEAALLSYLR